MEKVVDDGGLGIGEAEFTCQLPVFLDTPLVQVTEAVGHAAFVHPEIKGKTSNTI